MMIKLLRTKAGFSLVEILVVLVIMGLVTTAIMSLFQNTQETAYTQDEVVDLQQNLRIAADVMARDIMLAGFLIPKTQTPLGNAPDEITDANLLVIRSSTAAQVVGHLGADKSTDGTNTDETFPLANSDMVDLFTASTTPADADSVRIIRTPDHEQHINAIFTVKEKPSATTITLTDFSGTSAANFKQGDMLVKVAPGSTHPETISYSLVDGALRRAAGGSTQVVADKITTVDLTYILADGSEEETLASPLDDVAGVMLRVVGNAFDLKTKSESQTRSLVRVVMIRNR